MAPLVNIVCQNYQEDRIIPRMARALRDAHGWQLTAALNPKADVVYLSGYFEVQKIKQWPSVPVAAYLTHREEEPPGNAKAALFDNVGRRVNLRVATCKIYADYLSQWGLTIQAAAPLERDRFCIAKREKHRQPIIGLSGYTYSNHRKGEDLVKAMLASKVGQRCEWRASGRGWPVATKRYTWAEMPSFYQSLDVLVIPSRVEGIPMPPLEALACGVPVVIPRGVGLHDELPDIPGIFRYDRGDAKSLIAALEQAVAPDKPVDPQALRQATERYSVAKWCRDIGKGINAMMKVKKPTTVAGPAPKVTIKKIDPARSERGIYCVAFGEPSRRCASKLITSIKKFMPDVPVALCGAKPLGMEDVFIEQPDSDVGGRRAKIRAYRFAPANWRSTLYLDADTEVVAPIYRFFEWIEAGWEFVICKDPHLIDTMHAFERRNNQAELAQIAETIKTLHALQINGGVWAFARNERVAGFFHRWEQEWERYAQRDQGALLRALYADPLRVLWLGNEWNCFPKYSKGIKPAGLMHYPGDARRWTGMLPGRIDSPEAWAVVERYEGVHQ